jgi:fatty-acyl-CoA synthase
VFVPVNSRLVAEEVAHVLADCAAHTLVVEPGHQALVDIAATDNTDENADVDAERVAEPAAQRRWLLVDDDPATPVVDDPGPRWTLLAAALAVPRTVREPVPCREDDLAMLAYTSGTTGRAKGVMLTHGNLWWNGANLDALAETFADDVNLVAAPLFHTAPLGCFTLRQLVRGGTSVIRRSFDPAQALADLVEFRVTTFFAVPAMYSAIARVSDFPTADLSALRCAAVAGAPAGTRLITDYAERGVLLRQAYGLTETLFATFLPEDEVRTRIGSVGPALPFTQIRVREIDTGREITEPGECGEVCVRGPNVSPGYWNNSAGTATVMDGGWFRTGDVGHLDADGRLHIVDRLKDMAIVGGDNVYPAEIERVLVDFPGVLEVAVVGAPNAFSGERMVALVTCQEGVAPRLPEVRAFAEPHLARYKLPTRVVVVDSLPRNALGKIDKNAIRASLAA